ncbi:MAG TPA: hypothetical protein DEB56_10285 [Thiobacillus sp.]|nr:hypothetical protein [Thiobacillus sp.]
MNQQPTLSTINDQTKILQSDLEKLQANHEQIALKLVASPDDPDLLEAEEKSAFAIGATKRRIGLFNSAIKGAQTKEAQDAAAAKLATAVAARDEAVQLLGRRVENARKLDAALAVLGGLLQEHVSLGEQTAHAAKVTLKNARPNANLDDLQSLTATARLSILEPFTQALYHAGIDKAIGPGVITVLNHSTRLYVEDVATKASGRLAGRLDAVLRGEA